MPDNNSTNKTETMLLSLIASVAAAAGVSPQKAAKHFADDQSNGEKKWLVDFTMECMKIKMADLTKKGDKKK